MVIKIKGYDVLADDDDKEILLNHNWYVAFFDGKPYIACMVKNPKTVMLMHRLIMGLCHKDGKIVDHANGNTLDNRKSNLRICTTAQNNRNGKSRKSNTSGYKGVTFDKRRNKWVAQIKYNYKHIHLGQFDDPWLAYLAYCEASKKYHGEYGRVK